MLTVRRRLAPSRPHPAAAAAAAVGRAIPCRLIGSRTCRQWSRYLRRASTSFLSLARINLNSLVCPPQRREFSLALCYYAGGHCCRTGACGALARSPYLPLEMNSAPPWKCFLSNPSLSGAMDGLYFAPACVCLLYPQPLPLAAARPAASPPTLNTYCILTRCVLSALLECKDV